MRVVKYGASWCAPCKQVAKVLEDAGIEYEDINVEEAMDLAEEKHITNIPYIEFYRDGETTPTKVHVGSLSTSELVNIISSL